MLRLRSGRITLPGRKDRRSRDRSVIVSVRHEAVPFGRPGPRDPLADDVKLLHSAGVCDGYVVPLDRGCVRA